MSLTHPLSEEEGDKARDLHHLLGDAPCEQVTFIRCFWKGQPVTVVGLREKCDECDGHEAFLPLAVVITDEVQDQLMPYWELDGDQPDD